MQSEHVGRRDRYDAALAPRLEQVRQDRSVVAILSGASRSCDRMRERAHIDLVLAEDR